MLYVRKHFYNNGQLQWLELLNDEIPEGEQKTWYENGQPCLREFHRNGKVEGIRQIKYDNGNIDTMAQYRNGQLEGELRMWNRDGSILLDYYLMRRDKIIITGKNKRGFSRIKRFAILYLIRLAALDIALIPDLFGMTLVYN